MKLQLKWRSSEMLDNVFPNVKIDELWIAIYETFYMTIIALVATFILGILLGLLLYLTANDGIWKNKVINFVVAAAVNIFRAIPFIILILFLFPFTRSEEHTSELQSRGHLVCRLMLANQ